jgi:Carboxypeptidase regulatory-like domain
VNLTPLSLIRFIVPLALAISTSLYAQNATSGALTGIVTDPSNAVIPDAHVELRDNAKGISQTKSTNPEGEYLFSFVAPGNYTLTATRSGFQTRSQTLDVSLGPPATLNIRLAIEGAHDTVRVTEEAPLIHAENGDASSTMSGLQVAQVPNPGNDLTYIAQTAPGAIMNTDGGGGNFSSLGMPGTSNLFTLNGMSYTDIGSNVNESSATNLLLGMNQVQEATVVNNGYSGQFGVLAGTNVNYISKSGGNDFHGNALYFWNGRVLNANSWFNNAFGVARPFDNANQWAASIGGRIKKDKLFFFFDTEGLRLLVPQGTQQVILPSAEFEAATIANIDSKLLGNPSQG